MSQLQGYNYRTPPPPAMDGVLPTSHSSGVLSAEAESAPRPPFPFTISPLNYPPFHISYWKAGHMARQRSFFWLVDRRLSMKSLIENQHQIPYTACCSEDTLLKGRKYMSRNAILVLCVYECIRWLSTYTLLLKTVPEYVSQQLRQKCFSWKQLKLSTLLSFAIFY